MKMIRRCGILFIIIITALLLVRCFSSDDPPDVEPDEVMLIIQPDLKEDIGLLLIDQQIGDKKYYGGISNSDKSLLKKDETLYFSLSWPDFDVRDDAFELTLTFRVVTEYCDPNYENIYPEELLRPMNSISFEAAFGKAYMFSISGDSVNGYSAVFLGEADSPSSS